jgi:hypothetical protein
MTSLERRFSVRRSNFWKYILDYCSALRYHTDMCQRLAIQLLVAEIATEKFRVFLNCARERSKDARCTFHRSLFTDLQTSFAENRRRDPWTLDGISHSAGGISLGIAWDTPGISLGIRHGTLSLNPLDYGIELKRAGDVNYLLKMLSYLGLAPAAGNGSSPRQEIAFCRREQKCAAGGGRIHASNFC